jgi:hypothetical protein
MTSEAEQERHFKSLEAAALLAEQASKVALEKNWSYEKASKFVRARNPELCEMEVKGYVDEQESRSYSDSSLDAANILDHKAKELMKSEKIPYNIAVSRVYDDPENEELVRCYVQSM